MLINPTYLIAGLITRPRIGLAVQLRYLLNNQWRAIDSIANPHLNDDTGAIIALADEPSG
ncbi:MAG: hypothetical protein PVI92_02675 [Chromatiales bacterium]|jgi:hypothetical protein